MTPEPSSIGWSARSWSGVVRKEAVSPMHSTMMIGKTDASVTCAITNCCQCAGLKPRKSRSQSRWALN